MPTQICRESERACQRFALQRRARGSDFLRPAAVSVLAEMDYYERNPHTGPRSEHVQMTRQFTAIIEREDSGYVALCPELDIASQGDSIEEARANLQEALELFLETASAEEVKQRLREEIYVTRVEVAVG